MNHGKWVLFIFLLCLRCHTCTFALVHILNFFGLYLKHPPRKLLPQLFPYTNFCVVGGPTQNKTGLAYSSIKMKNLCKEWNINYITCISYNPQGEGITERTHRIKQYLLENKRGEASKGQPSTFLTYSSFLNFS